MDGKDKKNSMQAMIKGTPSKASSILKTLRRRIYITLLF